MGTEDIRKDLRDFLESCDIPGAADFSDDTSLLASGAMDSLALFNLVGWLEARIGRPVDPTTVALPGEWDSIDNIVRYVESALGPAPGPLSPQDATPAARGSGSVSVVRHGAENDRQVAELQTGLWSPDTTLNLKYLHWKYRDNPYGAGAEMFLAFDRQELVGVRGFYPSRWECGPERRQFDVLVADDLMIRSDHRNRGVYTQLMQVALADLRQSGREYLFNLSGGVVTVLGSLAMGWRSAGQCLPATRPTRRGRFSTALGDQVARLPYFWRFANSLDTRVSEMDAPFARLDRAAESIAGKYGGALSISKTPRPAAMAGLIARLPYDGRIRHVRDESFFAWRFANPLHEYRFLLAGGCTLDGYLVLQRFITKPLNHRVSIVDLEAKDDRTRDALLDAAIGIGRFTELSTWLATLDTSLVSDLMKRGFRPADPHLTAHGCPCILVRATQNEKPPEAWNVHGVDLLDFSNWDLRKIYTMAG